MLRLKKTRKIATGFSWCAHEFWLWSWHRDKHDPKTSYFLSVERNSAVAHAGNVSAPATQQSPNILFCHFVSKCQLELAPTDGISSINPSQKNQPQTAAKEHQFHYLAHFIFVQLNLFFLVCFSLLSALSSQTLNAQCAHRVYFVWWKLRSERRTMI